MACPKCPKKEKATVKKVIDEKTILVKMKDGTEELVKVVTETL